MLPKNRLGRKLFKKLKVYAGDKHPHDAQMPEIMEQ
jgi:large subunit ribosomal protein L13